MILLSCRLKPGRIVLVTAGRFAGRKGVVVFSTDSGTKEKPFGHALIAGVDKPPRKVHKRMSKTKIDRRCQVKAFVKTVNYNHLLPTR
jgi:large subunit ribosomal protein L27e